MKILVSEYNPIKFYEFQYQPTYGYNFRYMDDVSVEDAILSFQEKREWNQPWQMSDVVNIQIQCDTPGLLLQIIDCAGIVKTSVPFQEKETPWKEPGLNCYEAYITFEDLLEEDDYYFFAIKKDDDIILISDRIDLKSEHENSIYLQYHHRKNKGDLAFDTGIQFGLRILAVLQDFQPGSDETVYLDQNRNTTVLSSTPFRTYKLIIGDAFGVPDYVADKLNRIMGLSHVYYDGKQLSKSEGAKFERNGDRLYPFAGWTVEVIETVNNDGKLFEVDPSKRYDILYSPSDDTYPSDGQYLLK